jgi:hypothetical protein
MNASTAVALEVHNEKMVDKNPNEDLRFVRVHKQTECFFCGAPWYLSEGKRLFHQRRINEDPAWRFPTSCPECRPKSKVSHVFRCISGKQEFKTEEDAGSYSREVVEKRGFASQHPYQCPDCHLFYLTSQPMETSSGSLGSPLGKAVACAAVTAGAGTKHVRGAEGENRAEVARLMAEGFSGMEIANRLNISSGVVTFHKKKLAASATAAVRVPAVRVPAVRARVDERDLDAVEENLQRQLKEVQGRKARIAEARMLRVEMVNGTIRIVKEGEHMLVAFAERDHLVALLTGLEEAKSLAA